MNCVFAHAAYGVILDEDDQRKLNDALYEYEDEVYEEHDDLDFVPDILAVVLEDHFPTLLAELQQKYQSGPESSLLYTGSDDDHYGGSATDSETWIIGYGCLAFPDAVVPEDFKSTAEWHFWVTG